MHMTAHVIEIGQQVFGSAEPAGKDACGGDISGTAPTWSWDDFPGLTAQHCQDDTAGCEFRATGVTGPVGGRYVQGCIDGSSFQGAWNSCDYYAVIPHCAGNPILTLTHKRVGGETVVDFAGHGWDTQSCGSVAITAASIFGGQSIATEDASDFSGSLGPQSAKSCGVVVTATQQPNRTVKAAYSRGKPVGLSVVYAKPGVTPDGQPLDAGNVLCQDDLPAGVYEDYLHDQLSETDVASIAGTLGQKLLELYVTENGHDYYMLADPSGQVQVVGLSQENASPTLLEQIFDPIWTDPSVQTVQSSTGDVVLSGPVRAIAGVYSVQGNLSLQNATLYVQGNLNVSGNISGRGSIFATGSITAGSVNELWGADAPATYGLVALGALNLP